jgi:hypothetical protein
VRLLGWWQRGDGVGQRVDLVGREDDEFLLALGRQELALAVDAVAWVRLHHPALDGLAHDAAQRRVNLVDRARLVRLPGVRVRLAVGVAVGLDLSGQRGQEVADALTGDAADLVRTERGQQVRAADLLIAGALENSLDPAREAAPSARRPDPAPAEAGARADEPTAAPTPTRKPRTPKAQGAVELLQRAIAGYEEAITASAYAPPSPGYVDRIRAVAESCEHLAATMLNASEAAGVRWRPKTDMAELLPYELKRGGNRPGPAEMWEEFDAAFERLSITATGTDIVAVAYVFREVWAALRTVADELEGGGRSRVDPGVDRAAVDGPDGV